MTYDEACFILDEHIAATPEELFRELNGGVRFERQSKRHPSSNDLFILGEYRRDNLGRSIVLFYGSFLNVFRNLTYERAKEEIRKVFAHELRHHMESRGGVRDLEVEDEINLSQYLERRSEDNA